MLKQIFSVLALCCGVLCANAAVQYMTVEQKSGEKFSFLLKDKPVVTYKDGALVVNGSATTSYAIEGLRNYHFTEGNETEVKEEVANVLRVVNRDDNSLSLENAPAGVKVTLVSVNGIVVATSKVDLDGTATILLPSEKGVYVLTIGNQSFKIIRK
ncbi:MAG: hypothetical protein J6Y37_04755 [Paludibacteraceae bacterium]|nr:hypothetical protein [Paludibacteraceae bacterium]